jgi:predicted ester cyclase
MTTTESSPGALVATLFERVNAHDLPGIRGYWRADTEERFPDGTRRGPDEIGAWFEEVFAASPDLRVEVVSLLEQGDEVFVRWKASGTHTGGPFQGIAATGNRFELDGVDHFVIRDGHVATNFVIFDQMQFARAVGALPADGSAPDRALRAAFNAKTRVVERIRAARD